MPEVAASKAHEVADTIESLTAADAAAPLSATGLSNLVGLLAKAGREGEAAAYAARLLQVRPTHRRALRALTRSPRPEVDVIAGWRALAMAEPDDVEPWLQIARLAARAKDWRASLAACGEVLVRQPGHAEALNRKIAALTTLQLHDGLAESWLALHAADPKAAAEVLARTLDADDRDAAAVVLGAAGTLDALDPAMAGRRTRLAERLAADARDAAATKDAVAEARAYWRLARLEPGAVGPVEGLRKALDRLRERIDQAGDPPAPSLAVAARALAHFDPAARQALVVLGRIAAQTLAWREACEAFIQALDLEPADPGLRLELAIASARRGRYADAARAWAQVEQDLAASPQLAGALAPGRAALLGLIEAAHKSAVDRGDWARGWLTFDILASMGTDAAATAARLERLLKIAAKALGQAADARAPDTAELAGLYLAHAPGDPRATLILGRALLRERRYPEALEAWNALAELHPDAVEPALQIARLARRLDRADLGREAAARVLALDPTHAEGASLRDQFAAETPAGEG